MTMRRVIAMLCVPVVALSISCEKETPDEDEEQQPSGIPLPTAMTVCAYTVDGADTLEITAPAQLTCDSAGAPVQLPADTVRSWFAVRAESLLVSLADVSPIIRRILAGPSFPPQVAGFLDILDSASGFVRINGVFLRLEGSSGAQGLWRFAGIQPAAFAQILTGEMAETYYSMIIDPDGKAAMMFEFGADTLRGLLSRRTYGDAILEEALDTVAYNVGSSFVSDSTWRVTVGSAGEVVGMVADSVGDLYWAWSGRTHVYRQFPQQCPNPLIPVWLDSLLQANPR